MARFRIETNAQTGVSVEVPYTAEEEAEADAYLSAPDYVERQEAEQHKAVIKSDNFVQNFVSMTPAQVAAYIDANITSLATAKTVIEKLALMVLLLARREFR